MPRPKLRNDFLRRRVLHAAVATLLRRGASGFTTREVAREAKTSLPAVYELFGDKNGLQRAVFFEGFRRLGGHLNAIEETRDARANLVETLMGLRSFIIGQPELAKLMFGHRFADFDPGPTEVQAGTDVRRIFVERVQRVLPGDPTDAAHVLIALTQGLAATELARWLGTTRAARERRWQVGIDALLAGLSSRAGGASRTRSAGPRRKRE